MIVFFVPSTLFRWLIGVCVLSHLNCVVDWTVIVFCVPSTLCCRLFCVLYPLYTVLWVGL